MAATSGAPSIPDRPALPLPPYPKGMDPGGLEIICEVEPATRPDLMHVRHQIGVMSRVASAFLIPDNHIGRATVSSIAVAHEVKLMGGRSIAVSTPVTGTSSDSDRSATAAAYGVDEFLFVYGDRPKTGARSDDLSVRTMIAEARRFAEQPARTGPSASAWPPASDRCPPGRARPIFSSPRSAFRPAISSSGGPVSSSPVRGSPGSSSCPGPPWPESCPPISPSWRCPSRSSPCSTATRGGGGIAGELIDEIRESGAFDGIHLIPVTGYREMAARLEPTV